MRIVGRKVDQEESKKERKLESRSNDEEIRLKVRERKAKKEIENVMEKLPMKERKVQNDRRGRQRTEKRASIVQDNNLETETEKDKEKTRKKRDQKKTGRGIRNT